MPNLIDLRGSGPVAMPADMLSPLGFMSGVLYKIADCEPDFAIYLVSWACVANARDAMRAEAHQRNMEFEAMLWREAERQKRVAYAIPEPSAALRQFESDRESQAVGE